MLLRHVEWDTAMDKYTRFNRKSIQDRQLDTLIGLSKGLVADGKIDQTEAEFLHGWLIQCRQANDSPIITNLLEKVDTVLSDGVLDQDEADELLATLHVICGEQSEIGELARPTRLPINEPLPPINFEGHTFLFTGTCVFGSRKQCHEATEKLGGIIAKGVTKSLDYLVIGSYVSDSWAHENYGRKIEKAMTYRDSGQVLAIVTEDHWLSEAKL
jgi:NAD-dependent DNA ligase